MQELLPDNVIDALESQVIFPNSGLNPTLGVIIKENDGSDSRSYLKSIQQKGKKYNANIDVREVKDAAEAAEAINELKIILEYLELLICLVLAGQIER